MVTGQVLAQRREPAPKIGVPRLYLGQEIPVLYPGERATCAGFTLGQIEDAMAEALMRGDATAELPVNNWLVEPEPGWRGLYLRWRYRLLGLFVNRLTGGRPRLNVEIGDGR